jgi:hypothetical protein
VLGVLERIEDPVRRQKARRQGEDGLVVVIVVEVERLEASLELRDVLDAGLRGGVGGRGGVRGPDRTVIVRLGRLLLQPAQLPLLVLEELHQVGLQASVGHLRLELALRVHLEHGLHNGLDAVERGHAVGVQVRLQRVEHLR